MHLRWQGLAAAGVALFTALATATVVGGCTSSQQTSTGCGKIVAYSIRDGEPYFVTSGGLGTVINCFLHASDAGQSAELQFHYQGIDTSIDSRFSTRDHRIHLRFTAMGNGRSTEKSLECPQVARQAESVTFTCTEGVALTLEVLPASLQQQAGPPPT